MLEPREALRARAAWIAEQSRDGRPRMLVAVADVLELLDAGHDLDRIESLEAERDSAGSCWDEGPEQIGVADCDRVWLKCRLRAGHAGAHRDGHAEWMRRDSWAVAFGVFVARTIRGAFGRRGRRP